MNLRSTITSSALALAGLGLWSYAGNQLSDAGKFDYQPNPLGLNMSPYGQVIAMAIQAPIDADWHGALEIHDMPGADDHGSCQDEHCDHDHGGAEAEEADLAAHDEGCSESGCNHDHGGTETEEPDLATHHESCSDPGCDHDHGAPAETKGSLIDRLSKAVTKRTNSNPPTLGHKFYIRREIEKKLHFAYKLDPSHYANYAAYNLFLTQSSLGTADDTQEKVTEHVTRLAEGTISYCLRETSDPRPALTAAAAAYNILERQFLDSENHSTSEMRERLEMIDFCLKRHFDLLRNSVDNGNWDRLSPMRQDEVLKRSRFALSLREAAEKTIERLESEQSNLSSVNRDQS